MEWELILPEREVPKGWDRAQFLDAVKEQLIKDFEWDAERVAAASISLLQLLEDHISWNLERNATTLFTSFYKLDLGEQLVRNILQDGNREGAPKRLAEKSLQRAALKVWTRWNYQST
tara:strand:- start:558 stop:911 length:354 start_codon:yes stop_codon:yes gene_type:complete